MRIDLPGADGEKVISIELARKRYVNLKDETCQHLSVRIDRLEAKLVCRDCGKEINSIEWIAMMVEHWHYVHNLTATYREAAAMFAVLSPMIGRGLARFEGERRHRRYFATGQEPRQSRATTEKANP